MSFRVILYEGEGAAPLEHSQRAAVLRALLDQGHSVTAVQKGGTVASAEEGGRFLVLGRFNGALPADQPEGPAVLVFRELENLTPEALAALADEQRTAAAAPPPGKWKPWFPVIDYSRCTNCMQCLSFCLFEVYGVSKDHKIQVQNESNCKTECPACSRVCPEVAILFPKYRHSPINGDEVNADDMRREALKVDISALLGGDIYAALRDRSAKAKSRFSKERDEDRALKERQNCLLKLTREAGIPPEVLAALPSPGEILAKAEAAKQRAQAVWDRTSEQS
ncbi:MAG TPA: ferredoxin family protein [Bryobacteraceae bacterium]|nr:ferredoxin family protein [Bryobacteraceae bacterium]